MRKIHDLGNHEQSLHKVKNDLLFGITSLLGLNISLLPMASAHRRSFWLWFRWSSCKSKFKSMHKVWDIINQRREKKKVCSYELYLNITINNNSITHNKKEGNKKVLRIASSILYRVEGIVLCNNCEKCTHCKEKKKLKLQKQQKQSYFYLQQLIGHLSFSEIVLYQVGCIHKFPLQLTHG